MRTAPLCVSAVLFAATTGLACGADVTFTVDGLSGRTPISPWIYGINSGQLPGAPTTSLRLGGNRWTAYNWETNASNAGSDYIYQNDGYLSASNTPGAAVLPVLQSTASAKQAAVITVPMAGFVSADKSGPVTPAQYAVINPTNPALTGTPGTRFNVSLAAKGSPFSLTPNTSDGTVYQDEFANWVNTNKGAGRTAPVIFDLDNEPDLWSSTHAELRKNAAGSSAPITYQEIRDRTVQYATAIKNAVPGAVVLGPVNYGFNGYVSLQDAPDAGGRDFQTYYLQQMAAASASAGKRLIDALDVHYYPEAKGTYANGTKARIVFDNTSMTSTDPGMIAARVNAPRSLYDPTYVEDSWITQDYLRYSENPAAIKLLPRLQAKINASYPGTKIAMTEYFFGGGNHISGATAQADALGAFGANGVYAANLWSLQSDLTYISAAFKMFLNFDGNGAAFGDISIGASSSDLSKASIYASIDSTNPHRTVLVLINRTGAAESASVALANLGYSYTDLQAYRITDGNPTPTLFERTMLPTGSTSFSYTLAPYSVNTILLTGFPAIPEPAGVGIVGFAGALLLRRR